MAIDRADWHCESAEKQFREMNGITGDMTTEQVNQVWLFSCDHIAQMVRWVIDRGFEGEEADPEGCEMVRSGEMTPNEYLMEYCDGKFWESDVREDIMPFVDEYYNGDSKKGDVYLNDYVECCINDDDKIIYGTITNDEDYSRLKEIIDARYEKHVGK